MAGTKPGLDAETLGMVLDSIRDYAAKRLSEQQLIQWDARDECPVDVVREIGGADGLGIQLIFIPEEFGGLGGGAFDVYRVCEAVGKIDVGLATGVLATFLGSDPIVFGGTPEQKAHWLTRIAEEGLLMAYGATEPQAGSDLGAMRASATPIETGGEITGYVLNGNKQWISNGGIADVYTFLAKAPGGPSWFVVERGAAGLSWGKPEDKHGIRLSNTTTVTCENTEVPADALIGGVEGQGLRQAQLVFGYTRLMVAAFGLGGGWGALRRAIPYSVERIQGGGPLSEKQGYTHKLIVPNVVALEVARAYIEETATAIDAGGDELLNTEGAIAKYLATEAGDKAADDAIQALGGYGYTKEYMVEKYARDVRITRIYEGTSEIMEMTICRDRWQQHLKTRGEYYHHAAAAMEALHSEQPGLGGDVAALGLHALAVVLDEARKRRLTRQQHILFRLGELIARAEGAGAMVRRAAAAKAKQLDARADTQYDASAQAMIARIAAREAAQTVAESGLRWLVGGSHGDDVAGLGQRLQLDAIRAGQAGLLADMNRLADVIYQR